MYSNSVVIGLISLASFVAGAAWNYWLDKGENPIRTPPIYSASSIKIPSLNVPKSPAKMNESSYFKNNRENISQVLSMISDESSKPKSERDFVSLTKDIVSIFGMEADVYEGTTHEDMSNYILEQLHTVNKKITGSDITLEEFAEGSKAMSDLIAAANKQNGP